MQGPASVALADRNAVLHSIMLRSVAHCDAGRREIKCEHDCCTANALMPLFRRTQLPPPRNSGAPWEKLAQLTPLVPDA